MVSQSNFVSTWKFLYSLEKCKWKPDWDATLFTLVLFLNIKSNSYWWGCGKIRNLMNCWLTYKTVQICGKKFKHRINIIQQFDFLKYTEKNWRQKFMRLFASVHSNIQYRKMAKMPIPGLLDMFIYCVRGVVMYVCGEIFIL